MLHAIKRNQEQNGRNKIDIVTLFYENYYFQSTAIRNGLIINFFFYIILPCILMDFMFIVI